MTPEALSVAAAIWLLAGTAAPQTTPAAVKLTIGSSSREYAIPIDFSPANTQLVTLFQNPGIRNLRIGGGSVDDEIVAGTGSGRLLNPAGKPIPALEAEHAAVAEYIWRTYGAYVSSFAIGSEPDFHSYYTYTNHLRDPLIFEAIPGVPGKAHPSYLADRRDFASAILGSAAGATFSGPDTGAYETGWVDFGGNGLAFYPGAGPK